MSPAEPTLRCVLLWPLWLRFLRKMLSCLGSLSSHYNYLALFFCQQSEGFTRARVGLIFVSLVHELHQLFSGKSRISATLPESPLVLSHAANDAFLEQIRTKLASSHEDLLTGATSLLSIYTDELLAFEQLDEFFDYLGITQTVASLHPGGDLLTEYVVLSMSHPVMLQTDTTSAQDIPGMFGRHHHGDEDYEGEYDGEIEE